MAAHTELGIAAERVPLSGAPRYRGNGADVDLYVFGVGRIERRLFRLRMAR